MHNRELHRLLSTDKYIYIIDLVKKSQLAGTLENILGKFCIAVTMRYFFKAFNKVLD